MFLFAAVRAADVIVVVSGTDGALPSVVAGLVETPVVSNSVYGAHFPAQARVCQFVWHIQTQQAVGYWAKAIMSLIVLSVRCFVRPVACNLVGKYSRSSIRQDVHHVPSIMCWT